MGKEALTAATTPQAQAAPVEPVAPVESVAPVAPTEPAAQAPPAAPVPAAGVEPSTPGEPSSAAVPPVTPPEGDPSLAVGEPPPQPPSEPEGTRVVPEAADYKLPEGVPQVIGEFANKNDMTQEQLDATLTQMGNYLKQSQYREKMDMRAAGEQFVKDWGDNSKYNLALAKRALQQNDPKGELTKALNQSGYGNHPAVLKFLYSIGKSMKEGGFLKSAVNTPPGKKTLAQAVYGKNHPSEK